jgi:hypothetical protein
MAALFLAIALPLDGRKIPMERSGMKKQVRAGIRRPTSGKTGEK